MKDTNEKSSPPAHPIHPPHRRWRPVTTSSCPCACACVSVECAENTLRGRAPAVRLRVRARCVPVVLATLQSRVAQSGSSSRSGAFFRTVFSSGALFAHAGARDAFGFFFPYYHFVVSLFSSLLPHTTVTSLSHLAAYAGRPRTYSPFRFFKNSLRVRKIHAARNNRTRARHTRPGSV